MSKHTNGPWEFLEAGETESVHNAGRPLTVAEARAPHNDIAVIFSADDATVSITREQAIANARLIAKAPTMFAMLKELTGFSGYNNTSFNDAMIRANLLVEKIEAGEETP